MDGLYALKPWYAARLGGVRSVLVRRRVSPDAVTAAGVLAGGAAGAALALTGAGPGAAWILSEPGPAAGLLVAFLLAVRLACANLDGAIARETGRGTRWGAVLNELGDRAAELAALAGCLALAPAWLVAAAALAATLPSWAALAGAAAGGPRPQGGPVGKTERCLLLALVAFTGWAVPLLAVIAAGSLLTAAVRLERTRRAL
ncbi:CDP-alcohol phosphatidyltransferase family protein [Actinomadura fibrosa]|uniref:CDP-alcohol phosphatidyltransferase family protein n=2 Tax=Actinomadura fibrosa TaxID=111802 RepID=A0ABW2XXG2_9ACTN